MEFLMKSLLGGSLKLVLVGLINTYVLGFWGWTVSFIICCLLRASMSPVWNMTPKSGQGKEKYLNFSLHYLEYSIIVYLLNSLDEVLVFLFWLLLHNHFLKIKPDLFQEQHRCERYLVMLNSKDLIILVCLICKSLSLTSRLVCHSLFWCSMKPLLTVFRGKDLS